jgi:hypothetical protein
MFDPVSTLKKEDYNELNESYLSQFPTRDPQEKGIRDIAISLSRAIDGKLYQLTLLQRNEL